MREYPNGGSRIGMYSMHISSKLQVEVGPRIGTQLAGYDNSTSGSAIVKSGKMNPRLSIRAEHTISEPE